MLSSLLRGELLCSRHCATNDDASSAGPVTTTAGRHRSIATCRRATPLNPTHRSFSPGATDSPTRKLAVVTVNPIRSRTTASMSHPVCMIIAVSICEQWECQCRRCRGVFIAADAVQYVWEFSLGCCEVPVVVGVNATSDGFVTCALVYWHEEPDEAHPLGELDEFIVSCRPGQGTAPTEGDIARWIRWSDGDHPPRNWLIADGRRFRSVPDVVETLKMRAPMPDEEVIVGDWWSLDLAEATSRGAIRANWAETKRRNKRFWRT